MKSSYMISGAKLLICIFKKDPVQDCTTLRAFLTRLITFVWWLTRVSCLCLRGSDNPHQSNRCWRLSWPVTWCWQWLATGPYIWGSPLFVCASVWFSSQPGMWKKQQCLTHCGLEIPYGVSELGQHWLGNSLVLDGTNTLPEPMSLIGKVQLYFVIYHYIHALSIYLLYVHSVDKRFQSIFPPVVDLSILC